MTYLLQEKRGWKWPRPSLLQSSSSSAVAAQQWATDSHLWKPSLIKRGFENLVSSAWNAPHSQMKTISFHIHFVMFPFILRKNWLMSPFGRIQEDLGHLVLLSINPSCWHVSSSDVHHVSPYPTGLDFSEAQILCWMSFFPIHPLFKLKWSIEHWFMYFSIFHWDICQWIQCEALKCLQMTSKGHVGWLPAVFLHFSQPVNCRSVDGAGSVFSVLSTMWS